MSLTHHQTSADQVNEDLYPPLMFNLSIIGSNSKPISSPEILQQIKKTIIDMQSSVSPYARHIFGFKDNSTTLQILLTPCIKSSEFNNLLPADVNAYLVSPSEATTRKWLGSGKTELPIVEFDYAHAGGQVDTPDYVDWLVEQSDIILAFWDGVKDTHENGIWNYIITAADKNTPIIWVNPDQPMELFWCSETFSTPFKNSFLQEHIDKLLGGNDTIDSKTKSNELLELIHPNVKHPPFWSNFYNRYICSFKIQSEPPIADILLCEEYCLPKSLDSFTQKLNSLKYFFTQTDRNAITLNNAYRSGLLLRAILPFAATLALAVGFYAKYLGGYLFLKAPANLWNVCIVTGFILQALLNLFIQWLSDHNSRRGWHKKFIDQRYMAESLRMAVHFVPFKYSP